MKTVAALFIIALVAGVASAQLKPSDESLFPKIQTFINYQRDLNTLAKAQSGTSEWEYAMGLLDAATNTTHYLDAADTLLNVYDMVSCQRDRGNIRPVIKKQLSYYGRLLDSDIQQVNIALSFTKAQGLAATAVRMKDDMRDVKARFEALEASLK